MRAGRVADYPDVVAVSAARQPLPQCRGYSPRGHGIRCREMPLEPSFWSGRRVLVTGHTGFKGSWLSLWLQRLGAELSGFAPGPPTEPSLYDAAAVRTGMA